MDYKSQLQEFSNNLAGLEPETSSEFRALVDKPEKLSVYRRNFLQGAFERFAEDFVATANYLEADNFQFFVRKFLIDEGLSSENIIDASISFPGYLDSQFSIHQDDLLAPLSKIDLLWSHPDRTNKELNTPKGLLTYWLKLTGAQKVSGDIEIDFDQAELIQVIDIAGEQVLTIKSK